MGKILDEDLTFTRKPANGRNRSASSRWNLYLLSCPVMPD